MMMMMMMVMKISIKHSVSVLGAGHAAIKYLSIPYLFFTREASSQNAYSMR